MTWSDLTIRMEGSLVVLEPLEARHYDGLLAAGQHPEIWQWLPHSGDRPELFDGWFNDSLAATEEGQVGVFATIDRASGDPIGSTRYLSLRPEHRGLEIGYTWLSPAAWGTGANVEAKLLMLEHAFERLGCVRVEFKTDMRNERSRAAIAALPAQFEGTFRNHMTVVGVGLRDSAYYSIIEREWPGVRSNLQQRLAHARERAPASSA